jgi:eukaryotic-like serine/threonine-protein kinase
LTRDLKDVPESADEPPREDGASPLPHLDRSTSEFAYSPGSEPTAASPARAGVGSSRLEPGHSLAGRFVIVRFIARGGMGEVFEAVDKELGIRVALKTILPAYANEASVVDRFRREVVLARRVTHTNVCRIFELYSAEGPSGEPLKFLTMEFLDGESLAQRLKRVGRLGPQEALPLLRQMAAALDAAHAQGVVHRDFKPSNVMLVPLGQDSPSASGDVRVVVTDFGIARTLLSGTERDSTQTGAVLGTPQYMAPEQMAGGALTAAVDIFALGVVLQEMLTGEPPFAADASLKESREPLSSQGGPPPPLDRRWKAVLAGCLEREPSRRFSSAQQAFDEFERPSASSSRRLPVIGLLSVALVVAGLFGASRLRTRTAPQLATVAAKPRLAVAVVGLETSGLNAEKEWMAPTLAALLSEELGGAEKTLRVIPNEDVSQAKKSLGLRDGGLTSADARRLAGTLGATRLVTGALQASAQSAERLDVSLSLWSLPEGAPTAVASATVAPEDLLATAARLGDNLRGALGVALSEPEEKQLQATRPHTFNAARFYADALGRLARSDYPGAQQSFAASIAADASYHAAYLAEASTWLAIGNRKQAKTAAQRARDTSSALSVFQQRESEWLFLRASGDDEEAQRVYRELFDVYPDVPSLGFQAVLASATPEAASAVLERWHDASGGVGGLWLRLGAIHVAEMAGDKEQVRRLLDEAEQWAKDLGARDEMANVVLLRTEVGDSDNEQELKDLLLAEKLFREADDPEQVANTETTLGIHLLHSSDPSRAAAPLTAAIAEFRRLGLQQNVSEVLSVLFYAAWHEDDVPTAQKRLAEYMAERHSRGEPDVASRMPADLAWTMGDLVEARRAVQEARRSASGANLDWANEYEGRVLIEEDRIPEARAVFEQGAQRADAAEKGSGRWMRRLRCGTFCYEGRYPEGLQCYESTANHGSREETRCFIEAGDATHADAALKAFSQEAGRSPLTRNFDDVLNARAMGLKGEGKASTTLLLQSAATAKNRQWGVAFLEAELAVGKIELRTAPNSGRRRLSALSADARSKGFLRIARLARQALEGNPSAPGTRR